MELENGSFNDGEAESNLNVGHIKWYILHLESFKDDLQSKENIFSTSLGLAVLLIALMIIR